MENNMNAAKHAIAIVVLSLVGAFTRHAAEPRWERTSTPSPSSSSQPASRPHYDNGTVNFDIPAGFRVVVEAGALATLVEDNPRAAVRVLPSPSIERFALECRRNPDRVLHETLSASFCDGP